jgi:hypothetical protein
VIRNSSGLTAIFAGIASVVVPCGARTAEGSTARPVPSVSGPGALPARLAPWVRWTSGAPARSLTVGQRPGSEVEGPACAPFPRGAWAGFPLGFRRSSHVLSLTATLILTTLMASSCRTGPAAAGPGHPRGARTPCRVSRDAQISPARTAVVDSRVELSPWVCSVPPWR